MINSYYKCSWFVKIILIVFSASLALGTFNPLFSSDSGDGGTGLASIFVLILLPLLLWKYKGRVFNNIAFRNWQAPLMVFYFLSLFTVVLMASSFPVSLFVMWGKLLIGIMLCLLLPLVFRNQQLMYLSLLSFSLAASIICTLVLVGLLNAYVDVHNGRLWLWGENPNSTSTRWVLAIIYIANISVSNPLCLGKYRFLLLPLIFPLFMLVMMSGSRGSFLIAVIGLVLCLLTEIKKKPMVSFLFLTVGIIVFFYMFSSFDTGSYSLFDRFDNDEEDVRTQLLKASWQVFCESPILGVGQVDYIPRMLRYGQDHYAHNLYMHVLTINGIVGFIPLVIFNIRLLKGVYKVISKNSLPFVLLCYMMLIASKTGAILTYLFMWFVFGLVASMANNVMEDIE